MKKDTIMVKENERKEENETANKFSNKFNEYGITLIALVVTIVVLLILAGVSLNLVLGNNGIVTKAQEARIETRASTVEDEVAMWKDDKQIAKEAGGTSKSQEEMLQDLKDKNLISEDEIDNENEIINITDNYGNVVRQISYGIVAIEITETPAQEQVSQAVLYVSNVENLLSISSDEISNLSDETKKKLVEAVLCTEAGVDDFDELVSIYYEEGEIEEATEEAFWNYFYEAMNNSSLTLDGFVYMCVEYMGNKTSNGEYQLYEIINPQGEVSNSYEIFENGIYTFKVRDLLTNKIYTEKIEVSNIIDDGSDYYISMIPSAYVQYAQNSVKLAATNPVKYAGLWFPYNVGLKNKETGEYVTFDKAYSFEYGEKIDVSSRMKNKTINGNEINFVNIGRSGDDPVNKFIIEKDGVEYTGYVYMQSEY